MSLHLRLKTETDYVHKRLEKALDLMREDLTLDEYQKILKAFYGFYLPMEKSLNINPVKTLKLEKDLAYFNIDKSSLPQCEEIPNDQDASFQMGVKYVLEGSNLGAMVLTRHFQKILMLSPEKGLAFFSGHGYMTVEHWKSFLVELQTFSESKYCKEERVIAGAMNTFSLLYNWLIDYK